MGNAMIYAGIAIGVAALTGIMVYAHDNQGNYLKDSNSVHNCNTAKFQLGICPHNEK